MFGNTYVCEITFSTMQQVKSDNTNRWKMNHGG